VAKDVEKNIVTVGNESDLDLFSDKLFARDWHWIGREYLLPLTAKAKIRYRQADQEVTFNRAEGVNRLEATFPTRQRAITSGQIIAAYIDDELIGSGIIE
jgi:tRNA-specific 2-thiouridylase